MPACAIDVQRSLTRQPAEHVSLAVKEGEYRGPGWLSEAVTVDDHVRVKALAVALRQEAIRRALAMRCTAYSWRSVPEPDVSPLGSSVMPNGTDSTT
jgi:hypothetical protein